MSHQMADCHQVADFGRFSPLCLKLAPAKGREHKSVLIPFLRECDKCGAKYATAPAARASKKWLCQEWPLPKCSFSKKVQKVDALKISFPESKAEFGADQGTQGTAWSSALALVDRTTWCKFIIIIQRASVATCCTRPTKTRKLSWDVINCANRMWYANSSCLQWLYTCKSLQDFTPVRLI